MKELTKQQWLDKTPENNDEAVLQNLLQHFSKTKLEQTRRVLNEINSIVLFKTQYRTLPFITVLELINKAVAINQTDDKK